MSRIIWICYIDPNPLPGEIEWRGSRIVAYDAYLHRRVCSAVWLAMGRELEEKLQKAHLAFAKRCGDLQGAIRDITYLARFLQDVVTPLDDWEPDTGGGGIAMAIATSLSINADGRAEEQGRLQSFIDGMINRKIGIALERAAEVKQQIRASAEIFDQLLAQVRTARRGQDTEQTLERLVRPDRYRNLARSLVRNDRPPHAYVSNPVAFERLSEQIFQRLEGRL